MRHFYLFGVIVAPIVLMALIIAGAITGQLP